MKLFIDFKTNDTGKSKFLHRLIPALADIGVHAQGTPKGADVALGINKFHVSLPRKLGQVVRVDGLHLKDDAKSMWKNYKVAKAINHADMVIWQSEFCKKMWKKIMDVRPNADVIIPNGAHPKEFDVEPEVSDYPHNVLMCAKWFRVSGRERKSKRLKEMLEIAVQYCEARKDVCFWVAGEAKKRVIDHPQIKFLGRLYSKRLNRYYKLCDCMLYLAVFDWMPNAVAECLVAGTPVICCKRTPMEKIGGFAVDIDPELPPKIIKKHKFPILDPAPVCEALDEILKNKHRVHVPHLHIDRIAEQYKKAFKHVIKKA